MLARRKHPGGSNRLDDLCTRYKIDNSKRVKHGALLDAELLAEVYVELIGARQANLGLAEGVSGGGEARVTAIVVRVRPQPLAPRIVAEELDAHRAFIATLGEAAVWRKYLPGSCRLGRRAGGLLRHALLIERDEIDRIEHQRREAAVAHRRRDDLAGERKQQPRAFDQHQRLHLLLRHVLDPEHAGELQLDVEHHGAGGFGLAFQPGA